MLLRRIFTLGALALALTVSASAAPTDGAAPAVKDPITFNYHRCDAKYLNWTLHLWQDPQMPLDDIEWSHGMQPTGTTDFGKQWVRSGEEFGSKVHVNYIIHRGDIKEQGGKDMSFDGKAHKQMWVVNNDRTTYFTEAEAKASDPCFKK